MTSLDPSVLTRAQWRRSSYSTGGNQCVEVAGLGAVVAVRDSKNPDGAYLVFGAAEWTAFLDRAKRGDYDR